MLLCQVQCVQAPGCCLVVRNLPDFPAGIHAFSFKLPVWKYLFFADSIPKQELQHDHPLISDLFR